MFCPLGFTLNGAPYFYLRNLQGDVVAIYDAAGNVVAQYEYDVWGNILAAEGTLAAVNPIRYRGYYYDEETKLYYLQSRYYNSDWCRFISADVYMDTQDGILGTNMYAYCQGDPVNKWDPSGTEPITLAIVGTYALYTLAAAAIIGAGIGLMWWTTTPQFQQMWNDMVTTIGGAMAGSASWIASQATSIAQSIADSFAKTKAKPKYKSPTEIHHIVAQGAVKALEARNVLAAVGISVNSPVNLMEIKTGLHRRLHTSAYYAFANQLVVSAYNSGAGNISKQRNNVLIALTTLRSFVAGLNLQSPY